MKPKNINILVKKNNQKEIINIVNIKNSKRSNLVNFRLINLIDSI